MSYHTVGAANRQDLFTSNKSSSLPSNDYASSRSPEPVITSTQHTNDDDQPLELEHVMGYTGHHKKTLWYHPTDSDTYVSCMNSSLIIGKVSEAHHQEFLRGIHDEEISVLSVSPISGDLIASAQLPSTTNLSAGAPIVVWEYNTRSVRYTLLGFNTPVTRMAFSPDDRFLVAASSIDAKLILWDLHTSEVVLTRTFPSSINLLTFGSIDESSKRRPSYELFYAHSSQVIAGTLAYDLGVMSYSLSSDACQIPSTGLVRDYLCSTMTLNEDVILGGTEAGELVAFNTNSRVYRGTIPISSNGVHAVVTCKVTGLVFAGSGDGFVTKLSGAQAEWSVTGKVQLPGIVVSLSLNADGSELLAGTSAGKAFRILTHDLRVREMAASHTAPIRAVAFGKTSSSVFATISADCSVKLWDLSDYCVLSSNCVPTIAGCSLAFDEVNADEALIITGWEDGAVRAFVASTMSAVWDIPTAHRRAVLSVAVGNNFIVSGSADGGVSVWSSVTRELVLSFHEHNRDVTKVLVDPNSPKLIYSAGMDRAVYTYDLQAERRVVGHQLSTGGGFKSCSQRLDSENEIVTCGSDGRILYWDCDVPNEPVGEIFVERSCINCVSVSPSGKYIVTCDEESYLVKVHDIVSSAVLASCLGHSAAVQSVEWSPDERQVISVGSDSCICVWSFFGND